MSLRITFRAARWDSMSANSASVCLLLLFLTCVSSSAEAQKLTVKPDRGTTFSISDTQGRGCKVCSGNECDTSLLLKGDTSVSLDFQCSKPQDVFTVEINRSIECTASSCNGHIIQAEYGSLPLMSFNRKFTWNLKASAANAVKIDFSKTGLRQIDPSERCPDRHSYTLWAIQTTGIVTVGKYCTGGPVISAQLLKLGSFSLDIPAGQQLQNGMFDVSAGEEIKSLAKVSLKLPKGSSYADLLSPNYPDSFPDDDVMEWHFEVPNEHKTDIQFLNLTQPSCQKKEAAMEYQMEGKWKWASVLQLQEEQPLRKRGNFTMILRNCEMDRSRAGSPGLSLSIRVSSSNPSSPELCKVDLGQVEDFAIYIEKLRPDSDCEMKMNSVTKEKIEVTSSSELSFLDCHSEDIRVTARRVIACRRLRDCPKAPVRLTLPALPSCLPASLSSITWDLRPPTHGTVELTSPTGPLKQSLPGQPCNDSISIKVDEDEENTIGHFCPHGAIQKIQIHTNMTVTLSTMGSKALKTSYKNVLDACFKEEISERYIFTVSSKKDTPVLLATPGWPKGMKPYATVSWIVSVPEEMEAHVMFANLSQPKCSNRHTNIRVRRLSCLEEHYSRREDEEAESEIVVPGTFYLNMSNCMAEKGDFSVITKVTLRESENLLLAIILSVVAALLVVFVIVLVVVCVVIRKKKKKLSHQVSIYNPNGTIFLPGQTNFPKTREDNESHVYTTIEDTLVYTHLLRKGKEIGVYGESDQPCRGHTDSQKPLVSRDSGASDMETGVYHPFRYSSGQAPPLPVRPPSHPLVDNEIYQKKDQDEEEDSPNLGPRLEPEGGN
ncbi:CUB domain-containing protein 1-like isoform X2 [Echeneis naucrates]|uniref:CUB domain-containing protein 1-like isoform X2 n=1 Tax=Echeneis naucrates TaxID=173247 RepID=UPI0011136B53|nr:CUB domain-containing protein 1-like isoform X2 [Echeneis naucrates]